MLIIGSELAAAMSRHQTPDRQLAGEFDSLQGLVEAYLLDRNAVGDDASVRKGRTIVAAGGSKPSPTLSQE
jgi:hypothetical protein